MFEQVQGMPKKNKIYVACFLMTCLKIFQTIPQNVLVWFSIYMEKHSIVFEIFKIAQTTFQNKIFNSIFYILKTSGIG